MFDRLEKIKIFRKFLLSYLLILIIPLLASYLRNVSQLGK